MLLVPSKTFIPKVRSQDGKFSEPRLLFWKRFKQLFVDELVTLDPKDFLVVPDQIVLRVLELLNCRQMDLLSVA